MHTKRGQTWSLETYLAIGVFLIAVIFFYSLMSMDWVGSGIEVEVQRIAAELISGPEMGDGSLSNLELAHFVDLNCTELKTLFSTNKEICIYLQDQDGNLIENGTHVIHGIGCPGINVSGMLCGQERLK